MNTEPERMKTSHLYGRQTELTLENMSFSNIKLSSFPDFIDAYAKIKKAAALSNWKAGELDENKMNRICAACDLVIRGDYRDEFPVDVFHGGGGIGLNMNANEVIARLAGDEVDAINDVNMSQSTSEVNHTALRIALIKMLGELDRSLEVFNQILHHKVEEFKGVRTIARTCFQDGVSVLLSVFFSSLETVLSRNRIKLDAAREDMHEVNLGWTVIGTGEGASDAFRSYILQSLQAVSGYQLRWADDLYAAAQYPDDIASLSSLIRITASILHKFANDLRILSSGPETGFGELILPNVQAGSSFFPGKVNPVIPEMVIQCSMLITGNNAIVQDALDMGETYLNLWEEMMGFLVMDNINMLKNVIDHFGALCVAGIKADLERCTTYSQSSIPTLSGAKKKYSYQTLSQWIHQDGLPKVVAKLKKENEEQHDEKPAT